MPGMFKQVVHEKQWHLLHSLPSDIIEMFYLAGGTGLALQIGHRYSYDFDFFPKKNLTMRTLSVD